MIYLKEANFEDIEKEYLFVRDMPIDENGLTNPWHKISMEDFENIALPRMLSYSKGENLPQTINLARNDLLLHKQRTTHNGTVYSDQRQEDTQLIVE